MKTIKDFSLRLLSEEKVIVNNQFREGDLTHIKSDLLMKKDNPLNLVPGNVLCVEFEEQTNKTRTELKTNVQYSVVYFDDYLIKLENVTE